MNELLLVAIVVLLAAFLVGCVDPPPVVPSAVPTAPVAVEPTVTFTPYPVWAEPTPSLDWTGVPTATVIVADTTIISSPEPTGTDTPEPTGTDTPQPTPFPSPTRIGAAQTNIARQTEEAGLTGLWHMVQPGDTLYRLARIYGVTVEQIVALNVARYSTIRDKPELLEVGWLLRVK